MTTDVQPETSSKTPHSLLRCPVITRGRYIDVVQRPVVVEETRSAPAALRASAAAAGGPNRTTTARTARSSRSGFAGRVRRETLATKSSPYHSRILETRQRVAVDPQALRARQIAARRLVELRVERRGAIRLGGQRRAADRRAVDREMDARLLELAAAGSGARCRRASARGRPPATSASSTRRRSAGCCCAAGRRQPRGADRIVIDDRAQRERVVGVDPEREPLVARPALALRPRPGARTRRPRRRARARRASSAA